MTIAETVQTLQTGHIGLNVTDLERSKQFYQQLFGFEVAGESHSAERAFVLLAHESKVVLTLWQQSAGRFEARQPGLHHLSFQVGNMDEVRTFEARVRALNAPLHYDGVVAHGEGSASGGIFFTDPDGIRLEIFSPTGAAGYAAPVADGPTCGFF